jgi:hypothetical protein
MNISVQPHKDDSAFVETGHVQVVCDSSRTDGEHLKLGYAAMTMVDVHVGSVELAAEAKNAIRRAIKYDEAWEAELDL